MGHCLRMVTNYHSNLYKQFNEISDAMPDGWVSVLPKFSLYSDWCFYAYTREGNKSKNVQIQTPGSCSSEFSSLAGFTQQL